MDLEFNGEYIPAQAEVGGGAHQVLFPNKCHMVFFSNVNVHCTESRDWLGVNNQF